jgi:hypothetical protein
MASDGHESPEEEGGEERPPRLALLLLVLFPFLLVIAIAVLYGWLRR